MGLSDDQRAMLRLVAQRGEQGYEDVAALKGLSVDEVRAQVVEALAQLDQEGALAGTRRAEPPAAAGEPAAPAEPAKPVETPKPAPSPPPPASKRPQLSMPTGGALRAAIAAAVIVVALVVIILVVDGGGGDSTKSSASAPTSTETTASDGQSASSAKEVTKAILGPVGGGSAKGVAIFGRLKKSLALELVAEGLEPTTKGTSYTVWLAQSSEKMLPLASTEVPKSGKVGAQFEVPVEVLAYLANETFGQIVVTRTDDARLEAALARATKEKKAPEYTGDAVLSGTVTGPIVGAASR